VTQPRRFIAASELDGDIGAYPLPEDAPSRWRLPGWGPWAEALYRGRKHGAIKRRRRRVDLEDERADAVRLSIRRLSRLSTRLEWKNVAADIERDVATLRRWANKYEWPHPSDAWWRA